MIPEVPEPVGLTLEEANDLHIDEIISECSPVIWHFANPLALALETLGDAASPGARALQLLITVAALGLSDDSTAPFSPMMRSGNWRTPLPEDFSDAHFEALELLLDATRDPELRARIADVLWNRKTRNPDHARAAISGYLASAQRLFNPERWSAAMARLRRANDIAILLGRKSPEFQSVTEALTATLTRLDGRDPLYFSERIMALLTTREHSEEDLRNYRARALAMSERAEVANDFQRARAYLACALAWVRALEDQEEFQSLRLRIAETYVSEALTQGSEIARSTMLRRAVLELREGGAIKTRIDEVRAMLDDSQVLMLAELRSVGIPFDTTDLAREAAEDIEGVTQMEGFWKLAVMVPIVRRDELRRRVEESLERFSFSFAFSRQSLTAGGRFTGKIPGAVSDEPNDREVLIGALMRDEADRLRLLAVHGIIDPVRQELIKRFNYSISDIYLAIRGRPFIPRDREALWAAGLHAGLLGDYSSAVHLLVPQIDNSLRLLLQMARVIPYKQYATGVQDVFKMEDTLRHSKTSEILGDDVVFALDALLIGKTSSNLRNRLVHGLINDSEASAYDSAYCWWLALHIVARLGKPPAELASLLTGAAQVVSL